jgi:transposase
MGRKKLSDDTVASRMVELRNLRVAHEHDRLQIAELKVENKELRQLVVRQQTQLDTQAMQIAELQTMVFGKKKRPPMDGTPIASDEQIDPSAMRRRTKDSYRRSIPPPSTITSEVVLPLPDCCACGGMFDSGSVTIHERFEEDIPLPELTPDYVPHLVTKYVIAKGVCLTCGKTTTGNNTNLGGAQVSLGSNVRLLVCHLISVGGMSYSQVASLFLSLYGLVVTDGEIAAMLQKQHRQWLPAYTKLKADIRAAPVVHGDETPWPIQDLQGAGYAWNLCDAGSERVCFALKQSRGAAYAKELFGQDTDQPFAGVRISDDYSPYRNPELPGTQQLCWAHLYRTIRDTRYNVNLAEEQLPYIAQWYASFAELYQDLRTYLTEPYDKAVRKEQAKELWQRVQTLAHEETPWEGEPDKLTRLKAQLLRAGQNRLFTCLTKDTPCDNNRAERDLRQLVLKRKRSFGSKSERGATALATVLSLCLTTSRMDSDRYFSQLASLAG